MNTNRCNGLQCRNLMLLRAQGGNARCKRRSQQRGHRSQLVQFHHKCFNITSSTRFSTMSSPKASTAKKPKPPPSSLQKRKPTNKKANQFYLYLGVGAALVIAVLLIAVFKKPVIETPRFPGQRERDTGRTADSGNNGADEAEQAKIPWGEGVKRTAHSN